MRRQVAILMATYNGAAHLPEQLASIAVQDHADWCLYVSDDGSTDATVALLQTFQSSCGVDKVKLRFGPRQGFARNFMALLADMQIQADYYAFADQDDIWQADKISAALARLHDIPATQPALVCGPSVLIDVHGHILGPSPTVMPVPSFRNALVENVAGGNTMLCNRAARDLAARAVHVPVAWHDWWLYLAIMACGGIVRVDPVPHVLYRQHRGNAHGANRWLHGVWRRVRMIWHGQYRTWNTLNLQALETLGDRRSADVDLDIENFSSLRNSSHAFTRLYRLLRSGIRRQSWCDQAVLYCATCFGKV